MTWWRHQMETFPALLAICAGNSPVPGEFPTQRPVTQSFDVFFDLRLNKRLNKQSWGWWFETPSCSLWRHRNGADRTISNENYCLSVQVIHDLMWHKVITSNKWRFHINPCRVGKILWTFCLWTCGACMLLTHGGLKKMADILQTTFSKCILYRMFTFCLKCTKACSLAFNWHYGNIGSGDGLTPNRRQAITWTTSEPNH